MSQTESLVSFLYGCFCNNVATTEWVVNLPSVSKALLASIFPGGSKQAFMTTVTAWIVGLLAIHHLVGNHILCLFTPPMKTTLKSKPDTVILLECSVHFCDCSLKSVFDTVFLSGTLMLSVSLSVQECEHFTLMSLWNQHKHFHFIKALIKSIHFSLMEMELIMSPLQKSYAHLETLLQTIQKSLHGIEYWLLKYILYTSEVNKGLNL